MHSKMYLFLKADLRTTIITWLTANVNMVGGQVHMTTSFINRMKKKLLALDLGPQSNLIAARAHMCSEMKAIVKAVWFMHMAEHGHVDARCPSMASISFVEAHVSRVCRNKYDFMMVYKGFQAIGRSIDLKHQPSFTHSSIIEIDGDQREYYMYNPMTSLPVLLLFKAIQA